MEHSLDLRAPGAQRSSFFGFDIMITPLLIKVLFVVGILGCCVAGALLVRRAQYGQAVAVVLAGPLVLRVWCESVIVLFKIAEYLRDARR